MFNTNTNMSTEVSCYVDNFLFPKLASKIEDYHVTRLAWDVLSGYHLNRFLGYKLR